MSFVLTVCGSSYSITMGDGRLMNLETNLPAHERVLKVHRVNNNVCIGYTGNAIVAEAAFEKLSKYNVVKHNPRKIAELYIEKLKTFDLKGKGVRAIVSGKDKNNIFSVYGIDSSSENYYSNQYDVIPKNGTAILFACTNQSLVEPIIQKHLYNTMP